VRASTPLLEGNEQQQHTDGKEDGRNPRGRLAVLDRVDAAGDREEDRAEARQTDRPPEDERGPVCTAAGCDEHERDGDDRERADRHPDRVQQHRQHLVDRVTHLNPPDQARRSAA
jgi:hypothetical protein